MKKALLLFGLSLVMFGCSTEPNIEMRTINATQGINETTTYFMRVSNDNYNATETKANEGKTLNIVYNPSNDFVTLNNVAYKVTNVTSDKLFYLSNGIEYCIKFNSGYVWQDNKTRTKLDIYQATNKIPTNYDVYVYNN